MNNNEITISDFLSTEYKDFSTYVVESRALPSCIDSFKPTQRKIIHIANQIWKNGSEKSLKVFQLSGKVASEAFYHNGDSSLSGAIINMAQKFKNNLTLLEEDGIFGSLRSPSAGAPRYIGTKLSNNFRLIYKDFELLEYKKEEGEEIEPYYFLPIIPTVLINGSAGIAVGFACNILNRNPVDIINQCISVLKETKSKKVATPYNMFFTGDYKQDPTNHKRWIISGRYEIKNATTVHISELPVSMTYDRYEKILDELISKGKILSYEDNCKGKISYLVKLDKEIIKSKSDTILKLLKLEEYETENFNTLDELGKLKQFDSIEDIIKYFVDFRLKYYQKRKDFQLNKKRDDLKILTNRRIFIKSIIDNKLEIKNKSKESIIKYIEFTLKLDKIGDSYDYLLRMPLYSLTKELYNKITDDIKDKELEIEKYLTFDIKKMYLDDLNELMRKVK